MAISKILCATDFSSGAEHAVRTATRIAMQADAELVITNVLYVPAVSYTGDNPLAIDLDGLAEEAEARLDEIVAEVKSAGASRVRGQMLAGIPWVEIVELLASEAFDLCVIGTRGRTGIARVLLGSVAEQVVRHAPCSVLAVHPGDEPATFAHVLVPTDFSDVAIEAANLAASLTPPTARITLLHVTELPTAVAGSVPLDRIERELEGRTVAALRDAAAALAPRTSVPIRGVSRIGNPGAEILQMLDQDPTIDLVVTGSHGRTGIKRVLLGSVAEKLVRHARCPVVIARPRS